jgi:hypothetical protein
MRRYQLGKIGESAASTPQSETQVLQISIPVSSRGIEASTSTDIQFQIANSSSSIVGLVCSRDAKNSLGTGVTGDPPGGPGSLEVVSPRHPVHIEQFAREEQVRNQFGLHPIEIHL